MFPVAGGEIGGKIITPRIEVWYAASHQPDAHAGDCAPKSLGQFLITHGEQKICDGECAYA